VTGIIHDGIYLSANPSATGSGSGATNGSNGTNGANGVTNGSGNANGSNGNVNGNANGNDSQYTSTRGDTTTTIRPYRGIYVHVGNGSIIQYDYSVIKEYSSGIRDTFMFNQGNSSTGSNDLQVAAVRYDPSTGQSQPLNDTLL
jgi:hypothetical protein